MIELYRGNANVWECDEMGHLNVRYYVAKAQEAMAVLAHELGHGPAETIRTGAVLAIREHHIRFIRELHPGAGVSITGHVLDHNEMVVRVLLEVHHAQTGAVSATLNAVLECRDLATGAALPLSAESRTRMAALTGPLPDYAAPRGLQMHSGRTDASLDLAREKGMRMIARGQVTPEHCDHHGQLRPEHFIGRVADGIVNFLPSLVPDASVLRKSGKIGSAVVEYRLIYHHRPPAGTLIEVRTGLKAITERIIHLAHWIGDSASGRIFATSEAVALSLDLEARKAVPFPEEIRDLLANHTIADLSL